MSNEQLIARMGDDELRTSDVKARYREIAELRGGDDIDIAEDATVEVVEGGAWVTCRVFVEADDE